MKLKFKVNLKKCDIKVSSIIINEITYKTSIYQDEVYLDIAIVEKESIFSKYFYYDVYAIKTENNNEDWVELYSFKKRRRARELSKALKKYEDDKELERKIIKVLEKEKIKERKYTQM